MTARAQRLSPFALAAASAALAALATLLAYRAGPLVPLFLVAALAVAAMALLRPLWVLYLAILAIPLERYTLPVGGAFNLTPAKALLMVAVIAATLTRVATRKPLVDPASPLTKPFALLLLAVVPGLMLAADRTAVAKLLIDWTVFFLLYQTIVLEARAATVRNILAALAVVGAISAVMAIVSTGGGANETLVGLGGNVLGRAQGEFLSPNALAVLLAMALAPSVALALQGPKAARPAALAGVGLIILGLALSLSRGAFLATAAALATMLLWGRFRRSLAVAALAAAAIVVVLSPSLRSIYVINNVTQRIESIQTTGSADPRWTVWHDAINQFKGHPLFGVGAYNFKSRILGSDSPDPAFNDPSAVGIAFTAFRPHAHDIALNFAAELGMLGLVGLAWTAIVLTGTLAAACRRRRGRERALAFAIAAGIAAVFVDGFFDYPLSDYPLAALVVVLAGCGVVLSRPRAAVAAAPAQDVALTLPPRVEPPLRRRPEPPPRDSGGPTVPVLLVSSHALQGGAELQFERLVGSLGDGWIAGIVTLARGPLVERLRGLGHPVSVLGASGPVGLLAAAVRLRRIAVRRRPAVIHADGVRAAFAAVIAAAGTGIPVVWLKVDCSKDGPLANAIARRCRLVIGVSEAVTASLPRRLAGRVRTVPNGIPDYRFDRRDSGDLVHALIAAPARCPVVVHMARLFRPKGHLELLAAVPSVLERHPDAHFLFLVAGVNDPHEQRFLDELRERAAGLGRQVAFVVGHPEPVRVLAGCEVVVMPSVPDPVSGWREGFGLVAAEAMAVGTPIVAYAEGGIPEVVGDCGALVPTGDRVALAAEIAALLGDGRRRERLAACGRERSTRYRLDANMDSLKDCFRFAAEPGARAVSASEPRRLG